MISFIKSIFKSSLDQEVYLHHFIEMDIQTYHQWITELRNCLR